ncbi:GDP-mannose 4,6-dehydratase [candidate division WWE3 bacterium]|nr:GDP-mannose 4,6-dehydratase [candidate division WWE3 bacterium]
MGKTVLLTGGAGFIGHHTVEHFLKLTDWKVVIVDRLSYSGNLNFLTDIIVWEQLKDRVKFVYHDFRSPFSDTTIKLMGNVDIIIHMGAESHVDRSIENPRIFAESNVVGTVNMLELAKKLEPDIFIYVSTDEVYGPSVNGHLHKEGEPHRPSNPYSASKSGGEAFAYSYWNTYGLPVIITNTMNNFGERQNPEKFVPKTVNSIIKSEKVILHCRMATNKISEVSSRCWLHARNHADGLLFLIEKGTVGERYNITGEKATVEEVAEMISKILGKPIKKKFVDFHSFRPGHDMHYGLDGTKMKKLGWTPPYSLERSLQTTIDWMLRNPKWLL